MSGEAMLRVILRTRWGDLKGTLRTHEPDTVVALLDDVSGRLDAVVVVTPIPFNVGEGPRRMDEPPTGVG